MDEMNTVFACIEPDHIILFDNELIVGDFNLAATGSDVDQFLLILMIVKVILRKSFIRLENRDVKIERINT